MFKIRLGTGLLVARVCSIAHPDYFWIADYSAP